MFANLTKLREGNEAILFQMGSPLGRDLTNLFQKGFDYLYSLGEYDSKKYSSAQSFNDKRIESLIKYTEKTIVPEFKAITLKYTNLTVEKVYLNKYKPYQPSGMFAIDISFQNIYGCMEAINQLSGLDKADDRKYVKDFMSMSENWDENSPLLKSDTYKKHKGTAKYKVNMFFDPIFAFMMDEYLPSGLDIGKMEASEIAAIMMHEIGHANTIIERASDQYYQVKRVQVALDRLKANPGENIVETYSDLLIQQITTFKKQKVLDEKQADLYLTTISKVQDANKNKEKDKAGITISALEFLTIILVNLILFFVNIVCIVYFIRYIFSAAIDLAESITLTGANNNNSKVSDTRSTVHNMRLVERMADEFVSRNGMSGPLASGLHKLVSYFKYGSMPITPHNRFKDTRMAAYAYKLFAALDFALNIDEMYNNTYESDLVRLKRMAENTIGAFKQINLPAEVIDMYIADYEQAMKIVNKKKPHVAAKTYKAILKMLDYITNPVLISRALLNGNLNKDYAELIDRMDALSNNKMHYHAAKFDQLARNLKT